MAELLVCAVNQPGGLRYKQGDIVAVFPDGHAWGAREGLPTFWQITTVSLIDGDFEVGDLTPEWDPNPVLLRPRLLRRRRRFVDITQLSQLTQNRLASTGKATVLRAALLGALTLRA